MSCRVVSQSTSVLGHRRWAGSGDARLALSEAERARLAQQHDTTAAAHHYRLHDDFYQHFDMVSPLSQYFITETFLFQSYIGNFHIYRWKRTITLLFVTMTIVTKNVFDF